MNLRKPAILALLLFVSIPPGAAGQDVSAPGAGRSEAAQTPEERKAAYEKVHAAYEKNDWLTTLHAAVAILDGRVRDRQYFHSLRMATAAAANAGKPESCLVFADTYLRERKSVPLLELSEEVDTLSWIRGWRIRAFLELGRGDDLRTAATEFLREHPHHHPNSVAEQALEALQFDGKTGIHPGYDGKYRADPRFLRERVRLEAAIPVAMERLRARLGQADFPIPPFMVRIVDGGQFAFSSHMATHVVRFGERRIPVILVQAESLVTRAVGAPEALLTHEISHVCRLMSKGVHAGPPWVEEGVAMWAADAKGDMALGIRAFADTGYEDSGAILSALAGEKEAANADPDIVHRLGGLVFWDLERRQGVEAASGLARRLLSGEDWRSAFIDVDGRTLDAALRDLKARGPALLASELPEWTPLQAIVELMKVKKNGEALVALDSFLAEHPRSLERPRAELYRAHAFYGLKRDADARKSFERFVEDHPESPSAPHAVYWLIALANRAWDPSRVVKEGEAFLRDYPWVEASYADSARSLVKDAREALAAIGKPLPEPETPK